MVTTGGPAPVAISNVRARAGEVGVAQDYQGQSHGQHGHDEQSKPSIFVRIFTCPMLDRLRAHCPSITYQVIFLQLLLFMSTLINEL